MLEIPCLRNRLNLRREVVFVPAVVGLFFVVELCVMLHHEMWRDELQAWLIARDSNSLSGLFFNLRYEKHPALWHLCLYVISRFTSNPVAMQWFHLIVATASVFLFVKFSPFTKTQKTLYPFGYFPLFEYGAISRSYALGVLFVFVFCTLFASVKRNYVALAVVLFLLSNVNLHALIIAAALCLALLFDVYTNNRIAHKRIRIFVTCALLIASGIFAALMQIVPPSEGAITVERQVVSNAVNSRFASTLDNKARAGRAFTAIYDAYLPIPNFTTYQFWGTRASDLLPYGNIVGRATLLISMLLLMASALCLAPRPVCLAVYLAGTSALGLFSYLIFMGTIRHHGHLFLLFIACLWLGAYFKRIDWLSTKASRFDFTFGKQKNKFLTTLLCLHLAAGVFAVGVDLAMPFSASKEVAGFIKRQGSSEPLITGSPDYTIMPLSAYLDAKIFYLERSEAGTFIRWDNKRSDLTTEELFVRLTEFADDCDRDILFVSPDTLPPDYNSHRLRIKEITMSNKAIVADETYYLYVIGK